MGKSKYPKGVYSKAGYLYVSVWNPLTQTSAQKATKLKDVQKNYKAAREFKEELQQTLNKKCFLDTLCSDNSKPVNFSSAVEDYISARDLSASSITSIKFWSKVWQEVSGDKIISDFTDRDYHAFLVYLKKKDYSIYTKGMATRTLYAIFNYFVKQEQIKKNVIVKIKPPAKAPQAIPQLDLVDFLYLLEQIDIDYYYIVNFMYLTGFRIGETIRLEWKDVDLKKMVIRVRNEKGKRFEEFPIHNDLFDLLGEIPNKDLRIFPKFSRIDSLKNYYKYQRDLWGEKRYTIHQLRKTFITKLTRFDLGVYKVQALARHKDIRTTQAYYIDVEMEKLREDINDRIKF
ncbi:MAG: site-specific integrase [Bacteroidetes bacterium]|nr:site-specific integrase [Bacteroidota bacterium]